MGTNLFLFLSFLDNEGQVRNLQLNALKSTGVGRPFLEICSQIDFLGIA